MASSILSSQQLTYYREVLKEWETPSASVRDFDKFVLSKFPNLDEHERFLDWHLEEDEADTIASAFGPVLSAAQFWTHLHADWDNPKSYGRFYDFIAGKAFEPLILGSLDHNGVKPVLKLDRDETALTPQLADDVDVDLKQASYVSFALRYEDGNPSEDEGIKSETVSASEALFRYKPLGWIKRRDGDHWRLTGYALVLDLQNRNAPWIVLASEYLNDEEEGEEYPTIPRLISRHDLNTPGIWPGDMSRTPVAKLEGNFNGHFSTWFGNDVVFRMKRTGGRARDQWAPRLAHMMPWYEDPNGDWV
ncbi:hypothetical protein MMC17_003786 [Xylographa soralifera]|nr:hypothetical protein [Xylographa soralifera]